MICYGQEQLSDSAEIENLLDAAFETGRRDKSSNMLRENNPSISGLSYVARHQGKIVGTIRYFQVQLCDLILRERQNILFLGPLAVAPSEQGQSIGRELMTRTMCRAKMFGYQRVLLVGDMEYYSRFGFETVLPRYITLPDGRDARRLLVNQTGRIPALPLVGKLLPGWNSPAPAGVENAGALLPAA